LGGGIDVNKATTFSLPESLLRLIERVRERRRDPTRSDTVRVLLLQALAAMNYLPGSEKKALGIKVEASRASGGRKK
jgi:Arc/MetJ-type ribon-helix-helix transcriptional regulator